ncbi:type II toxin-antitoxin system HicA family toxin [Actinoplanes sp. RD1]|uniref:type II toxin-antitoxin system HicA family toxin n=1 Tax=Actinoplanes sp. RD1 TaxID=3064538 RepID=UPI0027427065|nr:type II toxin-antitoxin system HicA family toxin [Actinoplanes sp. RD1]
MNKRIERLGGVHVRTRGSHRRSSVTGNGTTAHTSVPQHPGDIPIGTLAAIQRDLEPVLGKGWLT